MQQTITCRICDVLDRLRLTWLSAPFWLMAIAFVLLSPFIWPLVLIWPVLLGIALVEIIRFGLCSACPAPFDATPDSGP